MASGHYAIKGYARFRRLYLQDYPVCEYCNREPAKHLHHPLPPRRGGQVMNRANAVALCYSCHRLETLRQKKLYGRI
jgi:5-methylcytosine-specific restriction endonuclease McrA